MLPQVGRLQAIAFQSVRQDDSAGGGYAHRQIPMAVTPAKPPKGAFKAAACDQLHPDAFLCDPAQR